FCCPLSRFNHSGSMCPALTAWLLFFKALRAETKCPTVLVYCACHIFRDTRRNFCLDFQSHSHIRPAKACQVLPYFVRDLTGITPNTLRVQFYGAMEARDSARLN